MSDKCGSCDCADISQCVRKESQYGPIIIICREELQGDRGDGKCMCGSSCACMNCTCGH